MRSVNDPERRGIKADPDSSDFLLEFDNTSENFMRGFECGEIWACLTDGVAYLQSIITASNAEMIMRMAEATGYAFEAFELSALEVEQMKLGPGDWIRVVMRHEDAEQQ